MKEEQQLKVHYKGPYFSRSGNSVHIDEVEVQEMIDKVISFLVAEHKDNEANFHLISTGDTLVVGLDYANNDGINIYVTQDYDETCIIKENGFWSPVYFGPSKSKREILREEVVRLLDEK